MAGTRPRACSGPSRRVSSCSTSSRPSARRSPTPSRSSGSGSRCDSRSAATCSPRDLRWRSTRRRSSPSHSANRSSVTSSTRTRSARGSPTSRTCSSRPPPRRSSGPPATTTPRRSRALYLDASRVTDRVADLAVQVTEGAENNYERARGARLLPLARPELLVLDEGRGPAERRGPRGLLPLRSRARPQRLLPVLRQRDGDDGEVARPAGTPRRRLRARRASGRTTPSSSARRTPTRGRRSTSPDTAGRSSRRRSRSTRPSGAPAGTRPRRAFHRPSGSTPSSRIRTWSSSCAAPAARLRSRRRTRSRAPSIRTSRMPRPPTSPRAGPTPCSSPSSCSAA